jgi:hypothetical protein
VNRDEWPQSAYDLSAMVKVARHLLQTIIAVTRALVALACSAMRSRAQLAAENLFLRKQLALYQERKAKVVAPMMRRGSSWPACRASSPGVNYWSS